MSFNKKRACCGTMLMALSMLLFSLFSCTGANKHSRDGEEEVKEMKASEVINWIKKGDPVVICNAIIWDDLDFTKIGKKYISTGITVSTDVNVPIYFHKCVFMGKVVSKSKYEEKSTCVVNFWKMLSFVECDFRDEVDFTRALFMDNIDYSRSSFRSSVKFDLATLRGEVSRFDEIVAEEDFDMVAAHTRGSVSFMDGKFKKDVNLQSLSGDNLNMNNVEVEGNAILSDIVIKGTYYLNYSHFNGDANFSYSRINGYLSCCGMKSMKKLDMSHCTFFGFCKFINDELNEATVDGCIYLYTPEIKGVKLNKMPPASEKFHIVQVNEVPFSEVIKLMGDSVGTVDAEPTSVVR